MKVRLLRDARIVHKAGEIVEVSPSEYQFLVSVGSAVQVAVNPEPKVETPEEPAIIETKVKRNRTKK